MTFPKPELRSKFASVPTAIAAALALIIVPLSAQAASAKMEISAKSNGETITVGVPTHLLDTEKGTQKLYAALQRRAEKSCKITIPMRIGSSVSVGICTKRLMNGFVADLNDERLSALHAGTS